KPVLTFAVEEDTTQIQVQFSSDGATVSHDTGPITASEGYLDPAAVPGTPSLSNGQLIFWRAQTYGPNGSSGFSEWAFYTYVPLPSASILSPPAVTDDGSPTLQWSMAGQTSWRAGLFEGDTLLDKEGWVNDAATSWTPGKS